MSATSSRWWSPTRRLQARDAAELISVAWEELPAAVDMEEADPARRAARLRRRARQCRLRRLISATKQKTDAAFAGGGAHGPDQNRQSAGGRQLHGAAFGGRRIRSEHRPLHAEHRKPGRARRQGRDRRADSEDSAGILRVVTQDVGGGFGTKAVVYREYPLVLEAARRLGRRSAGRPIAASISSATRKAATT